MFMTVKTRLVCIMKPALSYILLTGAVLYCIYALLYTTLLVTTRFMPLKVTIPRSTVPFMSLRSAATSKPSLLSSTSPRFLNKEFANSMKPGRIIPFYYRAARESADKDITITTLVTGNRFQVFSRLVSTYQGTSIRLLLS